MVHIATGVSFDVQPFDNEDGSLAGLKLEETRWSQRRSEANADLGPKAYEHVATVTIPWDRVADVVRDLVDWPLYYASGEAARNSKGGLHIQGTDGGTC